ncbi:MAG: hypothetical protein K0S35_1933 [Geminicoccaceae bacterium]|jgi:hypothetical protein|nr:hypothetical protein [Geminicoccaceae bacterium]
MAIATPCAPSSLREDRMGLQVGSLGLSTYEWMLRLNGRFTTSNPAEQCRCL